MIEFLFLDLDDTILDFHKAERIALSNTIRSFPGSPSSPAAITTPEGHINPHLEATSVSQSSHSVLSDSL